MLRSRSVRPLLALAVSAALLAGCASGPAGPLASVDGVEIPRAQLEGWVRAATDANPAIDAVGHQRDLLGRVIQLRIVEGLLAERGLTVDPSLVAASRAALEERIGGPALLAAALVDIGFPEDYLDEVVLPLDAAYETLAIALTVDEVVETSRTARHILVETAEEADEVFSLLADGADFATLAAERSTDDLSAVQGGDLGAQGRGAYVPQFEEAVWSAPLNTVLRPVETQFGFHVIEVTAVQTTAAADLTAEQRFRLVGPALDAEILGAIALAEVTLDPTIGVWDPMSGSILPG